MESKDSEWISLSDFMAALVATVIFMFMIVVMQTEAIKDAAFADQGQVKMKVTDFLQNWKDSLEDKDPLLVILPEEHMIYLEDGTFESCKAAIDPDTQRNLALQSESLKSLLADNSSVNILISGHTDAVPIGKPESCANNCIDNICLSEARASEARKELTKYWPTTLKSRVGIIAYGSIRPREGIVTTRDDPRNRRVEIIFESQ